MQIQLSQDVVAELRKIKTKNKQLFIRVEKQLTLFQTDPKHPSLRLHKLTGNLDNRWSISVTKSIRMVYMQLDPDRAYFLAIGTHDQVYRK